MSLVPCSDLSAAGWLVSSNTSAGQLTAFGPAGFPAYARLRFLPDRAYLGQSENDVHIEDEGPSETSQLREVLETLAPHTATPDECYFCLWDGWGSLISGGDGARIADWQTCTVRRGPLIAPAFGPPVLHGPKVVVPGREYFLFRGALAEFGDWGAADMWPGQPRVGMPDPSFIWPADHTWCVANDVDPHWAGIGADTAAIDQLLNDPHIDVVRADQRTDQPRYQ